VARGIDIRKCHCEPTAATEFHSRSFELVRLTRRAANPGHVATAVGRAIDDVFARPLGFDLFAKHGRTQPKRHADPARFMHHNRNLRGEVGALVERCPSDCQGRDVEFWRAVLLVDLVLEVVQLHELLVPEAGHHLQLAIFVAQIVHLRKHFAGQRGGGVRIDRRRHDHWAVGLGRSRGGFLSRDRGLPAEHQPGSSPGDAQIAAMPEVLSHGRMPLDCRQRNGGAR
jgi:hypothetical protein